MPEKINPRHPIYKRRYAAEIRRGVVVLGTGLSILLATGVYSLGLETRSIDRANKECDIISCQENVRGMKTLLGSTVDDYLAKFPRPSFTEVKSNLDQFYSKSDTAPYQIGISASLATVAAGIGSLLSTRRRDRKNKEQF